MSIHFNKTCLQEQLLPKYTEKEDVKVLFTLLEEFDWWLF